MSVLFPEQKNVRNIKKETGIKIDSEGEVFVRKATKLTFKHITSF